MQLTAPGHLGSTIKSECLSFLVTGKAFRPCIIAFKSFTRCTKEKLSLGSLLYGSCRRMRGSSPSTNFLSLRYRCDHALGNKKAKNKKPRTCR